MVMWNRMRVKTLILLLVNGLEDLFLGLGYSSNDTFFELTHR